MGRYDTPKEKGVTVTVGKSGGVDYLTESYGSDDACIQASIDYVDGLGGGSIFIREGEYVCSDELVLYDNITISGVGYSTHLRSTKYDDAEADKLFSGTSKSNICIKNLRVEGKEMDHGDNIYFYKCSNITVQNIYGTVARNFINIQYSNMFSIKNINMGNDYEHGILVIGCKFFNISDIILNNTDVTNHTQRGMHLIRSHDFNVDDVFIDGVDTCGIFLRLDTLPASGVSTDNKVENINFNNIVVKDSQDILFAGFWGYFEQINNAQPTVYIDAKNINISNSYFEGLVSANGVGMNIECGLGAKIFNLNLSNITTKGFLRGFKIQADEWDSPPSGGTASYIDGVNLTNINSIISTTSTVNSANPLRSIDNLSISNLHSKRENENYNHQALDLDLCDDVVISNSHLHGHDQTGGSVEDIHCTTCTNVHLDNNHYANSDIVGINRVLGPPAVPATTVNYTNAYEYPCQVQVYGGTVTEIDIDDIATGLTSGVFIIPPTGTINITYSVAPSWRWWGL